MQKWMYENSDPWHLVENHFVETTFGQMRHLVDTTFSRLRRLVDYDNWSKIRRNLVEIWSKTDLYISAKDISA